MPLPQDASALLSNNPSDLDSELQVSSHGTWLTQLFFIELAVHLLTVSESVLWYSFQAVAGAAAHSHRNITNANGCSFTRQVNIRIASVQMSD